MPHTWKELDLDILTDNIAAVRRALSPETELIFVVKSDAYGHGMIPVARWAWKSGVRWFAVAHIDEAEKLRAELPDAEILIVGVLDSASVASAISGGFVTVIVSLEHARELGAAARELGAVLRCHVKIDTGMGRLGLLWQNASEDISQINEMPGLKVEGACSHLASANEPQQYFAHTQVGRFEEILSHCNSAGFEIPFRHISNSGGVQHGSGWDFSGVRLGILLYGYGDIDGVVDGRKLSTRPFLQWKTKVIQVRRVPGGLPVSYGSTYRTEEETCLAVLDVGYADGYSRLLSNVASVLIQGKRFPVVGRVTMNLTVVDLGMDHGVSVGDEVVLLGQQGKESIWADQMATWRNTISYEVLTNINADLRK